MNKCVFSIGSVSYAMKAQRLLNEASIPSKIVKTKNETSRRGCHYGIETVSVYCSRAAVLLSDAGIAYEISE